ncbi:hypothetical protein DFJ58DRAFT_847939 [Suillus subalutaceus]|uniref:uncharacterized protein n=1 Tax=Suillus subalutaceus TaxID=48586 RepID=UPI001B85B570|nr:uncharacterized protein DFJ58DRAFT_847939 [Suillus subalutaceus]KAG1832852.1 hypothetical protein DFJ58DRAFT_847939 [Suillus subalutaceus]
MSLDFNWWIRRFKTRGRVSMSFIHVWSQLYLGGVHLFVFLITVSPQALSACKPHNTTHRQRRQADGETISKLKRNWRTLKALHILNNIDSQIQRCFRLLLHPCNLDDIGSMKNINGGADAVIAQKKAIAAQMDDLATQLGSYQDVLQVPIEINTDALQQAPVDRSDEISQVVLFLCVACKVVMGVGRQS